MSFATLEEAWGLPALEQRHPRAEPARGAEKTPFSKQARPSPLPDAHRGDFAPAPQLMPRSEHDDAAVLEARRILAQTYARFGAAGVLRLLPREAVADLRRGGAAGGGGARFWDGVVEFVSCPEKMLFVLLCAFALLVVWDGWQTSQAAHSAAALASLHMAPVQMTPFA